MECTQDYIIIFPTKKKKKIRERQKKITDYIDNAGKIAKLRKLLLILLLVPMLGVIFGCDTE